MRTPIYLFILLFIISCRQDKLGVEFTFDNKSSVTIDTVTISAGNTDTEIRLYSIKSGTKKTGFLDFQKAPQRDGHYEIRIYESKLEHVKHTGYYTNGFPLDKSFTITFENDTVRYEPTLRESY